MIWLLAAVAALLTVVSPANATTLNALNCTSSEVSSKLNLAVTGDTVTIPAGTCTWTSPILVNGKSIVVQGVGGLGTRAQCGVGGQTTFTCIRGLTTLFQWTTTATEVAGVHPRLTGFTWLVDTGSSGCDGTFDSTGGAVVVWGTSGFFRFDHNVVDAIGCGGFVIPRQGVSTSYVRGVADHNNFVLNSFQQHVVQIGHPAWNNVGKYGDNSWATDSTYGSAEAFYLEANTFTNIYAATTTTQFFDDENAGSRTVYRFNTFHCGAVGTHGLDGAGRYRANRHQEVYNNTWDDGSTCNIAGSPGGYLTYRGGTAIIFDNTITTSYSLTRFVNLSTFRRSDTFANLAGQYPFGRCGTVNVTSITRSGSVATVTTPSGSAGHYTRDGGTYITIRGADQSAYNVTAFATRRNTSVTTATTFTFDVSGTPATPATGTITLTSPMDGNVDATGSRCMDQSGAGKGDLISGDGPSGAGPGPGSTPVTPLGNIHQALEPFYTWRNLVNTVQSDVAPALGASNGADVTLANREYYNQDDTNCAQNAASCTAGVGRGTRAQRPVNCTIGVGWASTNGGTWNNGASSVVLDKCIATNTWQNGWYTPLAYPHFLTVALLPPPPPPPPSPPIVDINIGGSHARVPPPGVRFRDGHRAK